VSRLTIICGPAGAGKSTYGRELAAKTGACLLDSDTVTEPVVRAGMEFGGEDPDDRDSPVYRATFRDPVYECLYAVAAENLPAVAVILVGPFTSEIRDAEWPGGLKARFGMDVHVIFLTCPDEQRRWRIEKRGNPRDASKLRDWEAYLAASDARPPEFACEVRSGI
jgi:predicted kinase